VTIMVLDHLIQMRSTSQAQGALKELAKLLAEYGAANFALTTRRGCSLGFAPGDMVLVRPGPSMQAVSRAERCGDRYDEQDRKTESMRARDHERSMTKERSSPASDHATSVTAAAATATSVSTTAPRSASACARERDAWA
jgi:hypothetical protein